MLSKLMEVTRAAHEELETLSKISRMSHQGTRTGSSRATMTGKKAEVCKVKKSKRGSSPFGRMYLHLTKPKEPVSRLKVDFEFSTYNVRIAILGMSAAAEGFDDGEEVPVPDIMLI
ncbi:hypothetical protein NL676_007208 [Syzygium grande]|nr:hypothetical protein NL676_007208 [Syzygium grande]